MNLSYMRCQIHFNRIRKVDTALLSLLTVPFAVLIFRFGRKA